jgi:type III secretion protein D
MDKDIFELRIVGGLHKGAALALLNDRVRIGSDPSSDIVLLDDGVLEQHLCLRCEAGDWRIEPHGELMPVGVVFPIGQAALMLCLRWTDWPSASAPTPQPVIAATSARATKTVWFSVIGILLLLFIGAFLVLPLSASKPTRTVGKTPALPSPMQESMTNEQQQRKLVMQLLSDRTLKDFVEVKLEANSIIFKADLNKLEMKRMDEVVHILSQRLGSAIAIRADIRPIEESLPFDITEVFLGPVSYIKTKAGATVYVGEAVDGVVLNAIRPGVLEFSGSRVFEVSW